MIVFIGHDMNSFRNKETKKKMRKTKPEWIEIEMKNKSKFAVGRSVLN